jgi:hypothetical protein
MHIGGGPPATNSHFYAVLVTSSLWVKLRRVHDILLFRDDFECVLYDLHGRVGDNEGDTWGG